MQSFGGVLIEHRHGLLSDNGPGINPGIDKVDGAASDLDSRFKRLFPGFQPRECRQQRGMDVHKSAFERLQKIPLQNAHETSQRNQIHFGPFQSLDICSLGLLVEFRAEFAGGYELCENPLLARALEDTGPSHIAQHHGNGSRHLASATGLRQGNKIRPSAGTQHTDSKRFFANHRDFLQATDRNRKTEVNRQTDFGIFWTPVAAQVEIAACSTTNDDNDAQQAAA